MKKRYIVEFICCAFICLFTYSAVSKLIDFQRFKVQLGQSPLLTVFSSLVAWLIPTVELLIAAFLAIPVFRLTALYACFSLMVVFTAYIVIVTQFSEYTPCSCGGVLQHMSWNQHLVFNLGFVSLGLVGIILDSKRTSHSSQINDKEDLRFI